MSLICKQLHYGKRPAIYPKEQRMSLHLAIYVNVEFLQDILIALMIIGHWFWILPVLTGSNSGDNPHYKASNEACDGIRSRYTHSRPDTEEHKEEQHVDSRILVPLLARSHETALPIQSKATCLRDLIPRGCCGRCAIERSGRAMERLAEYLPDRLRRAPSIPAPGQPSQKNLRTMCSHRNFAKRQGKGPVLDPALSMS